MNTDEKISTGKELTVELQELEVETARWELEQRKSKAFATSLMVPQHLRDLGSMLVLNQMSRDMNLPVLMLAQNLFMVKGKIGMSGQLVIGLINRSDKYDHDIEWEEEFEPEWRIRAVAEKDGRKIEGIWVSESMIVANGWFSNPNWKTLKSLMGRYRAATFFARTNCPEVLGGFHTDDELTDIQPHDNKDKSGSAQEMNRLLSEKEPTPPQPETKTKIKKGTTKAKLDSGDYEIEIIEAEVEEDEKSKESSVGVSKKEAKTI